jgi:hypothetical protein
VASASDRNACESNFHESVGDAYILNPPSSWVDIYNVPQHGSRLLLDCVRFERDYYTTGCSIPIEDQAVRVCTRRWNHPADAWSCQNASDFFVTPGLALFVGGGQGPIEAKVQWTTVTAPRDCFPMRLRTVAVTLNVPDPGQKQGAFIAFIIIVACVALVVVGYGAYTLRDASQRFSKADVHAAHSPRPAGKAFRSTLKAVGAPPTMTRFYEDDPVPPQHSSAARQRAVDVPDEQHAAAAASRTILDNNQVLTSTALPRPWFAEFSTTAGTGAPPVSGLNRSPSHHR